MVRWQTHTEESVEGGYTREKEERTTENKMERRVSTRFEKYWTESGRGDGQGDVEEKDHQLYRRPYMMGKARGKEEEYCTATFYSATCSARGMYIFMYSRINNQSILTSTIGMIARRYRV